MEGSGFRPEANPESRWESGGHVFLEVRVLGSPRPGCRGRVSDGEALAAAGCPVWGRRARGAGLPRERVTDPRKPEVPDDGGL